MNKIVRVIIYLNEKLPRKTKSQLCMHNAARTKAVILEASKEPLQQS